jgi:hypothetical protein
VSNLPRLPPVFFTSSLFEVISLGVEYLKVAFAVVRLAFDVWHFGFDAVTNYCCTFCLRVVGVQSCGIPGILEKFSRGSLTVRPELVQPELVLVVSVRIAVLFTTLKKSLFQRPFSLKGRLTFLLSWEGEPSKSAW